MGLMPRYTLYQAPALRPVHQQLSEGRRSQPTLQIRKLQRSPHLLSLLYGTEGQGWLGWWVGGTPGGQEAEQRL